MGLDACLCLMPKATLNRSGCESPPAPHKYSRPATGRCTLLTPCCLPWDSGVDFTSMVGPAIAGPKLTFVLCSFSSVTFPLDLTKTRLQVQGEAAARGSGAAAGQAVPYRGMLRTAAGVVQEEGLLKLWQGATPAVYRHIGDYRQVRVLLAVASSLGPRASPTMLYFKGSCEDFFSLLCNPTLK